MDYKNGKAWDKKQTQRMQGQIAYCKYIEPKYVDMTIKKYEEKTGVKFMKSINSILHS